MATILHGVTDPHCLLQTLADRGDRVVSSDRINGGNKFVWNTDEYRSDCTALHLRRLHHSYSRDNLRFLFPVFSAFLTRKLRIYFSPDIKWITVRSVWLARRSCSPSFRFSRSPPLLFFYGGLNSSFPTFNVRPMSYLCEIITDRFRLSEVLCKTDSENAHWCVHRREWFRLWFL
jgi:hypothetical protein